MSERTSDDKPSRLDEILKSGRAPGFVVRGSESRSVDVPIHSHFSGPLDPKKRKEDFARRWRAERDAYMEKKRAASGSRKKDGAIRHIGTVDMEIHKALEKKHGDEFKGSGKKKILKEYGLLWDD